MGKTKNMYLRNISTIQNNLNLMSYYVSRNAKVA